jgi:hypothetical protein
VGLSVTDDADISFHDVAISAIPEGHRLVSDEKYVDWLLREVNSGSPRIAIVSARDWLRMLARMPSAAPDFVNDMWKAHCKVAIAVPDPQVVGRYSTLVPNEGAAASFALYLVCSKYIKRLGRCLTCEAIFLAQERKKAGRPQKHYCSARCTKIGTARAVAMRVRKYRSKKRKKR